MKEGDRVVAVRMNPKLPTLRTGTVFALSGDCVMVVLDVAPRYGTRHSVFHRQALEVQA